MLEERQVRFDGEIEAISVSTIDLFGRKYVSGLRLQQADGTYLNLGYCHPDTEMLLVTLNGPDYLIGFHVALDERGVRGLRVLWPDERLSE